MLLLIVSFIDALCLTLLLLFRLANFMTWKLSYASHEYQKAMNPQVELQK